MWELVRLSFYLRASICGQTMENLGTKYINYKIDIVDTDETTVKGPVLAA